MHKGTGNTGKMEQPMMRYRKYYKAHTGNNINHTPCQVNAYTTALVTLALMFEAFFFVLPIGGCLHSQVFLIFLQHFRVVSPINQ